MGNTVIGLLIFVTVTFILFLSVGWWGEREENIRLRREMHLLLDNYKKLSKERFKLKGERDLLLATIKDSFIGKNK